MIYWQLTEFINQLNWGHPLESSTLWHIPDGQLNTGADEMGRWNGRSKKWCFNGLFRFQRKFDQGNDWNQDVVVIWCKRWQQLFGEARCNTQPETTRSRWHLFGMDGQFADDLIATIYNYTRVQDMMFQTPRYSTRHYMYILSVAHVSKMPSSSSLAWDDDAHGSQLQNLQEFPTSVLIEATLFFSSMWNWDQSIDT